jgi:hypothetical protein
MNKSLRNEINLLFREQLATWELAMTNYKALKQVQMKTLYVKGSEYRVQFNPARIISSSAQVDPQSIQERPCFLCRSHRPPEQKSLPFKDQYQILVNPYPIFPRHLTIPSLEHTPQRIANRFGDMLDLTFHLSEYIVFYNGPQCGASAPDHFHFQAGSRNFLPIEKESDWRWAIVLVSDGREEMLSRFQAVYDTLPLLPGDDEPMLNILTGYKKGEWTTYLFPRKKHRPTCYSAIGDANLLISPASVDMGGVFITPLEKDFKKITAADIATILGEVLL